MVFLEKSVLEHQDFKLFWGACPQSPLVARTLSAHVIRR